MHDSLRNFLAGLIDYAGLFPPASLALAETVASHRHSLEGDYGWIIGRFVLPVALLAELPADDVFPLAVIVSAEIAPEEVQLLGQFRDRIELVETRLPAGDDAVRHCTAHLTELQRQLAASGLRRVGLFLEAEGSESLAEAIAAFARNHAEDQTIRALGLKLRCACADAAAPPPETVAATIGLCRRHNLAMKFTAGLHQPLRHAEPKTGAMLHGFLNIFAAALLLWSFRLSEDEAAACLDDGNPEHFRFRHEGLSWRDKTVATAEILKIRKTKLIGFGSCSFDEPVAGLQALGLLNPGGE